MVLHSLEALPSEAVGLLGGYVDGRVVMAIPLPNIAGSRAFWADPLAQYHAERELRARGLTSVAAYHSHPGGGDELSAADRALAPVALQVVIGLGCEDHPEPRMRAYWVRDGSAIEVAIRTA